MMFCVVLYRAHKQPRELETYRILTSHICVFYMLYARDGGRNQNEAYGKDREEEEREVEGGGRAVGGEGECKSNDSTLTTTTTKKQKMKRETQRKRVHWQITHAICDSRVIKERLHEEENYPSLCARH